MRIRPLISVLTIGAVATLAACERTKSASPLSPTIAGPIAGVEITQPVAMQPANNAQIPTTQQPITLTIGNATSTGVRPLSYVVEIGADVNFATVLFSQTGITPGSDGKTVFQLPQNLQPERTYFWRTKAQDGANAGIFSDPATFRIFTPVIIQAPTPIDPSDGATLTTRQPTLGVANAQRSGPAGAIRYTFEVATDQAMANRIILADVNEQASRTNYTVPDQLAGSTRFFWRALAHDDTHQGPWSPVRSFVTPAAVVTPPPGGGGGPAPGDQINLNTVTIVKGVSIAGWAVTSTMGTAHHTGGDLCTPHSRAGQWPVLPFFDIPGVVVEGNQWMFANIGGKWYGGAGEWLRPGQTCKSIDDVGSGVFYDAPPLNNWHPSPGETIGVAVSTPARSGQWGTAERSNVILIKW